MESYLSPEALTDLVVTFGPKLVGAILVLIIGLWITGALTRLVKKSLEKSDTDEALQTFIGSVTNVLLKVLVYITAISILGVPMTSFIAIITASFFAVGLALSGTLQNFAGGVMILLFKPFRVGHFIQAQGHMGTVKEIQVINTVLHTPDNKVIIIPNGGLSTSSLTNFSMMPTRRVDWTFGIAYGDDVDKAYEVLNRLIAADERILKDPAPFIAVKELGDSSVDFVVRAWVNSGDFWGVFFKMNEEVYKTFDKEGLSIPFPQRDVHLYQHKD
ncbi:small conductance mechanosensitive channel [Cyclonatronum proteinivorum]|uniref:Small conductance mechanosensitive channel n=1 Tax=Cyclonatronum proteinivorum TaxID=1457365 RepID=A0A345UPI8_9BACT|nr:mechanosensitive ion channel domain-containing protein [Cyclonatronum proteinivorum]AXJ02390.1 small conductance mechanosensitive channel [Cyclonatronum proteinivorum]